MTAFISSGQGSRALITFRLRAIALALRGAPPQSTIKNEAAARIAFDARAMNQEPVRMSD
jgi:hypothetical protein